jgi:ribonuclease J
MNFFHKSKVLFHGSSHNNQKNYYQHGGIDSKKSVRIVPLGGSGNVTKNMYLYEYRYDGKLIDLIVVDCGVGFPEPDMYGVDLVIPDTRYLIDKKDKVRGFLFTHGHDDHIGGIPYIVPKFGTIPLFGTKLTAAFANLKLKERKLNYHVTPVEYGQQITLGAFTVTWVRVTHSIPDTAHIVIQTPIGTFYHGSDFKFDPDPIDGKFSDYDAIQKVGQKGVMCMTTDCLGVERSGFTPSEKLIAEALEKEIFHSHGKILFSVIASNVSRIQLAIDTAIRYGRQVAFLGRSIDQNVEEAVKLGYMQIPRERIITDRDLKRLPKEKQFLIVAGSQAQPESALVRISNGEHRLVSLDPGDTVIFSSDPIPGNETNINTLVDQLFRKGARVSYTANTEGLHVSGHGSQGDQMQLLSMLGPRFVYPIGGSFRHIMQYRELAHELGYNRKDVLAPDSGEIVEFKQGIPPKVVQTIELEQVMVDGLGIGDVGHVVLRDRQTIASEGIVVIIVPIERETGRVMGEPDIVTRGFVYVRESTDLLKNAKDRVTKTLKMKKGRILDWQYIKKRIEDSVGQLLQQETGRTPLIVPVILEV